MKPPRVVIIGGGIIGCAVAWRLAQRGAQVVVLEKETQPGTKSSWAAAGMLLPILESDSLLRPLAAASFAEYPQFVAELREATGIDARLVIEGPHSGSVDNRELTRALHRAAAQAGAEFRFGVTARKVVSTGARFQLVEVADGNPVQADAVVIAAGAWSGELLGLPLRLPVVPVAWANAGGRTRPRVRRANRRRRTLLPGATR